MPSVSGMSQSVIDMTVAGDYHAFTVASDGRNAWCDPVEIVVCEAGTVTDGFAPLVTNHNGSTDETLHFTKNGYYFKETT